MFIATVFALVALGSARPYHGEPSSIRSINLLSEFNIESNVVFQNTTVGGLSAITYDNKRDVYYLLSDDRVTGLHRFYTAKIDLMNYTVSIIDVTFLKRTKDVPFVGNDLDPEGIVYTTSDTLVISSEREPPAILEFNLHGSLIRYFNVPGKSCMLILVCEY